MSDANTLTQTARWFEQAVPEPTKKSFHVQLGCHFEEVAEMLDALPTDDSKTAFLLGDARIAVGNLAEYLKTTNHVVIKPKSPALLDALCDQIVTATGVGHMLGYHMVAAMDEVNASNWSKFVDGKPIFNENGKIMKGPQYFAPNLTTFMTKE
jgi:NTP pyrophosphatase (non-canonical NTP hydrolase)